MQCMEWHGMHMSQRPVLSLRLACCSCCLHSGVRLMLACCTCCLHSGVRLMRESPANCTEDPSKEAGSLCACISSFSFLLSASLAIESTWSFLHAVAPLVQNHMSRLNTRSSPNVNAVMQTSRVASYVLRARETAGRHNSSSNIAPPPIGGPPKDLKQKHAINGFWAC